MARSVSTSTPFDVAGRLLQALDRGGLTIGTVRNLLRDSEAMRTWISLAAKCVSGEIAPGPVAEKQTVALPKPQVAAGTPIKALYDLKPRDRDGILGVNRHACVGDLPDLVEQQPAIGPYGQVVWPAVAKVLATIEIVPAEASA